MKRRKNLIYNTCTGILFQFVKIICGFILPKCMLLYFGSEVNGLVSAITHFLSFISLLDMGVGAVIQANLYSPLARKDSEQISKIVVSAQRFFNHLAGIFLIYICFISVIIGKRFNSRYDIYFTISLVIIIAISIFAQYFLGISYELLLNADQKAYVQLTFQICTVIINTVLSVILMKIGASIHIVKLLSATVFVLRPILQILYVKKNYNINNKIMVIGEPIKQKWNGFSQHLASVVCENVDVVVLTFLSTLENVSIYSVYFTVTNGVTMLVITAATGIESLFGNMIANKEHDKLSKMFDYVEWILHTIVTIIFTITSITIVPFIKVYTKEITDTNYDVPFFGMLLVMAYGIQCLRIPYFRLIKAAGHFKETQNGAFASAGLNIIISLIMVYKYGLIGVALGTLIAMLYHTCYFVFYLSKNILNRSIKKYIKCMIIDMIIVLFVYLFTKDFFMNDISYVAWILLAIKVTMITLIASIIGNFLFNKKIIADFGRDFFNKASIK